MRLLIVTGITFYTAGSALAAGAQAPSVETSPAKVAILHDNAVTVGVKSRPLCESTLPASEIQQMVQTEATAQGADVKLALAISMQESRHGRDVNSPAGARGTMQLMPETAAQYGVSDICDPAQNIKGGVHFLKDLTAQFQGNMMLVAAAYNAGPEAVYRARGVPPNAETVRYVAAVTNTYYGLDALSARRGKSTRHSLTQPEPPRSQQTAVLEVSDVSGVPVKQNWIGGSVLYVGNDENGVAHVTETK